MDNLKVLDRRVGDTSMKVEHIGLCFLVPHRALVVEFNYILHVLALPSLQ